MDCCFPQLQSFSGVMGGWGRHFGSHLSGAGGSFRSSAQLTILLECHEPYWSTVPRGSILPSRGSSFGCCHWAHCYLPPPATKRTALFLSLNWRLASGLASLALTWLWTKLFPVNPEAITGPPKMSLLLEAKSMPALIIKPRFILVTHTDDLGWYIAYHSSTGLSADQMLHQGRSCIAPQTVTWCFRKPFLLTHKFVTTWAIEMTADREDWPELPIGATTATRISQEHQSSGGQVFHHAHG